MEQIRAEVRIEDQKLENQNAKEQRALDLQIAQMEYDAKQTELQIAQVQHQADGEQKMKQIALSEQNKNARHQSEIAVKAEMGTGI